MKVIVTTSHRPTTRTRSFVKDLVAVIPNSSRFTRGKATFNLLALLATDFNADRILVVRNWKGNPRFLDIYAVEPLGPSTKKICTIVLKGIKLAREAKCSHPPFKPKRVVVPISDVSDEESEKLVECLSRGLYINPVDSIEEVCRNDRSSTLVLRITCTPQGFRELKFYDCEGRQFGPVIRVWKTKLYLDTMQK